MAVDQGIADTKTRVYFTVITETKIIFLVSEHDLGDSSAHSLSVENVLDLPVECDGAERTRRHQGMNTLVYRYVRSTSGIYTPIASFVFPYEHD